MLGVVLSFIYNRLDIWFYLLCFSIPKICNLPI